MTPAPTTQSASRWHDIMSIWQHDKSLFGLVGLATGFIFGIAASDYLGQFLTWFAGGFWNEAISIAITVTVLDRLNKFRAEQERKEELIFQLGSTESSVTKQAGRLLRHKGYVTDGSLRGAKLGNANLTGAKLSSANLMNADMGVANLTGANLMEANLTGANLVGANLTGTQLFSANLTGAELMGANLTGTKLGVANLSGAELTGAYLKDVDLFSANLTGADLGAASLINADLREANLTGANLRGTQFDNVNWHYVDQRSDEVVTVTLPDGTKWNAERDMAAFTNDEHPDFERTLHRINEIRHELGLEPL